MTEGKDRIYIVHIWSCPICDVIRYPKLQFGYKTTCHWCNSDAEIIRVDIPEFELMEH